MLWRDYGNLFWIDIFGLIELSKLTDYLLAIYCCKVYISYTDRSGLTQKYQVEYIYIFHDNFVSTYGKFW